MAADGAPTEQMYSSDIIPDFWDISYDLYRDADRMKARFIPADLLDPASPLDELRGKVDILLANQIFHLFDWERQIEAGKNMIALSRPGTWLVGYHIGSVDSEAVPVGMNAGGKAGTGGSKTRFLHNSETWQEMWRQLQEETSTEWEIESFLLPLEEWDWGGEDSAWMGPSARGFEFIVRRVDGSSIDGKKLNGHRVVDTRKR